MNNITSISVLIMVVENAVAHISLVTVKAIAYYLHYFHTHQAIQRALIYHVCVCAHLCVHTSYI